MTCKLGKSLFPLTFFYRTDDVYTHLARSIFICSLLVAKGSYSLNITEQSVDLSEFLRQSVTDLQNFAYMEGVSVRVRKEDIIHKRASSDFNRIRQVIHSKYFFYLDNFCRFFAIM